MSTAKKAMRADTVNTPCDGGSSAGQLFLSMGAKLHPIVKHSAFNRLARTEFAAEQWFAL
jgi:hypothetical protein